MNTRLASAVLAATLALGAPATFAQSYNAPAGIPAATAPGGYGADHGRYDDLTTGSVGTGRFDSSAKGGNAEQNTRRRPNVGTTSGGPAY